MASLSIRPERALPVLQLAPELLALAQPRVLEQQERLRQAALSVARTAASSLTLPPLAQAATAVRRQPGRLAAQLPRAAVLARGTTASLSMWPDLRLAVPEVPQLPER